MMPASSDSKRKCASERGATSAEYALLASLIAVCIIGGVTAFGMSVTGLFDRSCDEVAAATSQPAC
jgi:Flp pilus assembly pilin Flp